MNKNTLTIVLAITLSGLGMSANAALPSYTFTDLGTLGGGSSYATAINNVGQVAGMAYTSGNYSWNTPTVWNGTIATNLDGNVSYAAAINNSGQVAGNTYFGRGTFCCYLTNYYDRATVWNGTTTTYLANPQVGNDTYAVAINDAGQVAGNSVNNNKSESRVTIWNGTTTSDLGSGVAYAMNNAGEVAGELNSASGVRHATVWNGTIATDLGTLLGGNSSGATAINDAGQVVGWSSIAGNEMRATIWNGTTATDIGTLGGNSSAFDINASGLVVGTAIIAGAYRATIWDGTANNDLNSFLDASSVAAGWVLTQATGINDNGWIVGSASNSLLGISNHAFVMSVAPVPEPDSYAMIMIGLGLMGFVARRRKNQQV